MNRSALAVLLLLSFHSFLSAQSSLEIWEIQGAGLNSNYQGQTVSTTGNIVTAKGSNFLFIQCPSNRSDNDPATSDGMLVLTPSNSTIKAGDRVDVQGQIIEENSTTAFSSVNLSINVVESGVSLPPAVALNNDFPTEQRSFIPDLERVEGMRVVFNALVCGPPADRDWIPVTTKDERRLREPGILYPGLPNLPSWDGNPELFWMDLDALSQPNNRFVSAEMEIQTTGVMVQVDQQYVAFPVTYELKGENLVRAVRDKNAGEFSVGSINTLRLIKDESGYNSRVKKMALYVVNSLKSPDVLALQEIGGQAEMEDLAFHIRQIAPQVNYQVQFLSSNGNIHTAFLVQPTLTDLALSQLSKNEFLSIGGTLHDRPPILLSGQIATTPPTPIKVLNLHLRSLLGIEGGNSSFVRTKRKEQAVSVAEIVQNLRNENLVVVGDFNAYEFSDGYVDVVNQIAGTPTEGALLGNENIVSPPLIKHSEQLAAVDRYSFIFQGNSQMIDHCLSTELNDFQIEGFEFARGNADNSWVYGNNPNIVERSSDHDGFVLFLRPNNGGLTSTDDLIQEKATLRFPNPMRADQSIYLDQTGIQPQLLRWFDVQGRLVHQQWVQAGENTMQWSSLPSNGLYFIELQGKDHRYKQKVILQAY